MRILKATAIAVLLGVAPIYGMAAEAGGHHPEGVGIPLAVLYAAINFLILAAILVYFLKKPAKEFFASRATLIRTQMEQAQELKAKAARQYGEYENRLQGIDAERKRLIEQLKQDGELERKRILQTARDQVVTLKSTSEKVLTQELRKAKEALKQEAVTLATDMAEKLIRENIVAADQNRLIEEYLNKMEKLA